MEDDLRIGREELLRLRYGFAILDREPEDDKIEALYAGYIRG